MTLLKSKEIYVNDRQAIAVTSMARAGSRIYLGLTAGAQALAAYDIDTGAIEALPPVFPWVEKRNYCTKIHNALGVLADGSLLIGEGNHFTWDGLPVTSRYLDRELPESMLGRKRSQGFPEVAYTDFCLKNLSGWNRRRDAPGGKIVRFDPATGQSEVVASLPPYLYVQSMVVDPVRNRAFGHTIPDNHFFYLNLDTGELQDHGRISDYSFHNLAIAPNGICYGAWIEKGSPALKLLRFDPQSETLSHLEKVILPDIGPKVAGNQGLDQWLVTRDGTMYVGTAGQAALLRFDWERERFITVSSRLTEARVTSLDEDENGMIWMGAGYPHMQLLCFNPVTGAVSNYGRVNETLPRCYFHCACYFKGKLYLGETDGFSPSIHILDLQSISQFTGMENYEQEKKASGNP